MVLSNADKQRRFRDKQKVFAKLGVSVVNVVNKFEDCVDLLNQVQTLYSQLKEAFDEEKKQG